MGRVFAYCRVSTTEQHPENQLFEIKAAGFDVMPRRVVTEHISGSVQADQRPKFADLLNKMEEGDVLIVTRLDRLGRDAIDVVNVVDYFKTREMKIHCLQLGGADLTSAAGRMIMHVIAAMAEFERDLLIERTQAGLQKAREKGIKLGRPSALDPEQEAAVLEALTRGVTIYALAQEYGVDRRSIRRIRDRQPKEGVE